VDRPRDGVVDPRRVPPGDPVLRGALTACDGAPAARRPRAGGVASTRVESTPVESMRVESMRV
jgi:hypothetical protein